MKNEFDVALGQILKEIRLSKEMSLNDVGIKMKCTRQMIYHYEQGRTPLTVDTLLRLCDIYDIDISNVLTNTVRG